MAELETCREKPDYTNTSSRMRSSQVPIKRVHLDVKLRILECSTNEGLFVCFFLPLKAELRAWEQKRFALTLLYQLVFSSNKQCLSLKLSHLGKKSGEVGEEVSTHTYRSYLQLLSDTFIRLKDH